MLTLIVSTEDASLSLEKSAEGEKKMFRGAGQKEMREQFAWNQLPDNDSVACSDKRSVESTLEAGNTCSRGGRIELGVRRHNQRGSTARY